MSSTLKIERDKLYTLRSGAVVRCLATDLAGNRPIAIVFIKDLKHTWQEGGFGVRYADGRYDNNPGYEHMLDIVAEHVEPLVVWANTYDDGIIATHQTEHEARRAAHSAAIRVAAKMVEAR